MSQNSQFLQAWSDALQVGQRSCRPTRFESWRWGVTFRFRWWRLNGWRRKGNSPDDPWGEPPFYTLLVEERDAFIVHMQNAGIEASPVHARNDRHEAFHFPNGPLPGVDYFAAHEVAVPVGWWLTEQERERVAQAVEGWSERHR